MEDERKMEMKEKKAKVQVMVNGKWLGIDNITSKEVNYYFDGYVDGFTKACELCSNLVINGVEES